MDKNFAQLDLWNKFSKSGNIEDYMKFKKLTDKNGQEFAQEFLCSLISEDLKKSRIKDINTINMT